MRHTLPIFTCDDRQQEERRCDRRASHDPNEVVHLLVNMWRSASQTLYRPAAILEEHRSDMRGCSARTVRVHAAESSWIFSLEK